MVKLFMPGIASEELALRARIYLARDRAHSRAESVEIYFGGRLCSLASDIAGEFVFRREMSGEELFEVLKVISWLHLATLTLERLESTDDE